RVLTGLKFCQDISQISHLQISPQVFEELYNLRLLHFYWGYGMSIVNLSQGLEYLPTSLRLLHWDLYPSPTLPLNFNPDNLVSLQMRCSSLEQLWNGDNVRLVNLKTCDLSGSDHLIKIMDLCEVPNLEELNLSLCYSLVEIPYSIQFCSKLTMINLSFCKSLCGFSANLRFTSLQKFISVGVQKSQIFQNFHQL
ncbi:hypothetical protein Tsubulata_031066, partial [Turnera subulata]